MLVHDSKILLIIMFLVSCCKYLELEIFQVELKAFRLKLYTTSKTRYSFWFILPMQLVAGSRLALELAGPIPTMLRTRFLMPHNPLHDLRTLLSPIFYPHFLYYPKARTSLSLHSTSVSRLKSIAVAVLWQIHFSSHT